VLEHGGAIAAVADVCLRTPIDHSEEVGELQTGSAPFDFTRQRTAEQMDSGKRSTQRRRGARDALITLRPGNQTSDSKPGHEQSAESRMSSEFADGNMILVSTALRWAEISPYPS
jgi:hypothetical protein